MKKKTLFIILLAIVFVSSTSFADNHRYAETIDWWESFFTNEQGLKFSYEYQNDREKTPQIYTFTTSLGYVYLYIRLDFPEEIKNKLTENFREQGGKNKDPLWENVKVGYAVLWCSINANTKEEEIIKEYWYSDLLSKENKYIVTTDENSKFIQKIHTKIPFNKYNTPTFTAQAAIKKHNVTAVVSIFSLESNPYEFEGKTVAVSATFQRMLSGSMASFFSGYSTTHPLLEGSNIPDQIIVSGIPKGTHFDIGYNPNMFLILKGKGAIAGTNAYGAKVTVPNFQYLEKVFGELPKR